MVRKSFSAVEALYRKQKDVLYDFVLAQVLQKELAEDIVADTFCYALGVEKWLNDKSEKEQMVELLNIAQKLCDKEIRDAQRGQVMLLYEESSTLQNVRPDWEAETQEAFVLGKDDQIYDLRELHPSERKLLEMIAFERKDPTEVAKMLGISTQAVYKRLSRIRKKTRCYYEEL